MIAVGDVDLSVTPNSDERFETVCVACLGAPMIGGGVSRPASKFGW